MINFFLKETVKRKLGNIIRPTYAELTACVHLCISGYTKKPGTAAANHIHLENQHDREATIAPY